MKIQVKLHNGAVPFEITENGDWIDLRAGETVTLNRPTIRENNKITFDYQMIDLGVSMKLPKGYEALINPRSSLYKNFNIISANSQGVIDNSYSGNDDTWKLPVVALHQTKVHKGNRICQFRIQLSQKASIWQKIKWLFDNKIEFVYVDDLNSNNRGGFGTSGIK